MCFIINHFGSGDGNCAFFASQNSSWQLIACNSPITSGKCNITRGYFKFREGISPYERAFILDIKWV